MPRALCAELVAYLGTRTDCVSRACTTTGRYYFVPTAAAQANLDAVGVEFGNCRIVKDFSEVKGDVTQISAISAGDMNIPAKEILPLWRDRIGAAITGEHWLDFTAAGRSTVLAVLQPGPKAVTASVPCTVTTRHDGLLELTFALDAPCTVTISIHS